MNRERKARSTARNLLVAVMAAALVGCGGGNVDRPERDASLEAGGSSRPLTTDEAQRLAVMRFNNFRAGVRSVRFEVDDTGRHFTIDGWVDFTAGLGYGSFREGRGPAALMAWTASGVTSHPPVQATGTPPLPPPDTGNGARAWTSSALAPQRSRLHAALKILLHVGRDRPDNSLLLRQTDARWIRSDVVSGVPVDVLSGPTADKAVGERPASAGGGSDGTVRYWVDQKGRLLRMELRLGGSADWTVIDLGDAPGVSFADAFRASAGG